jgi:hypothetical protein
MIAQLYEYLWEKRDLFREQRLARQWVEVMDMVMGAMVQLELPDDVPMNGASLVGGFYAIAMRAPRAMDNVPCIVSGPVDLKKADPADRFEQGQPVACDVQAQIVPPPGVRVIGLCALTSEPGEDIVRVFLIPSIAA